MQRQQRSGGKATGIGDASRAAELLAVELRQPVHRLFEVLRARVVRLVPPPVLLRVLEPEVGADVEGFAVGDRVVVETEGGPVEGVVVIAPRQVLYSELRGPLDPVLRKLDADEGQP